jgi:diguanylate cyclase
MQQSPSERRRAAGQAPATQALLAELTILRHGLGTVRDAATEWLPGMVGLLLRLTDLARDGALRAEDANADLVRTLERLSRALEGLDTRVSEVASLAAADPLTGALNRAALTAALDRAVAHAEAADEPLAVVFCDLDHFKQFNDRHGHNVGDHALRLVASALSAYPDPRRIVARYGGEEFVLAMPGRTGEEALFIAQAIASALARRTLRMRGTGEALGSVRLSAGVSAWRRPDDAGALLRRAEAALYRAKRAGRGRVALGE